MVQISRRVSTRMLRSLLRIAACSKVSDATESGLAGRPRPRGGGAAAPEAVSQHLSLSLPPFPAGGRRPPSPRLADSCLRPPPRLILSELLPTHSSRRRVPISVPPSRSSQAATMLLMSECCFQSPFLPGRIGVHTISPMIRSSNIQPRTAASVSLPFLLTCKYPEIFAILSVGVS